MKTCSSCNKNYKVLVILSGNRCRKCSRIDRAAGKARRAGWTTICLHPGNNQLYGIDTLGVWRPVPIPFPSK